MPTNEEILEMADSLDAPIYWMAGTGPASEDENIAPRRAAAMLRLWVKEREAFEANCTTLDELEAEMVTKQ